MQAVRACPDGGVYNRARLLAEFRRSVRLDVDFPNSVNGQKRGCVAGGKR